MRIQTVIIVCIRIQTIFSQKRVERASVQPFFCFPVLFIRLGYIYFCDMAKFSNTQDFINEVLRIWASNLIRERIAAVRKEEAIASKELLQSYEFEIRKATIAQAGAALIAFEQQGRFLDMKRIDRGTNQLPIDEIKKWIKDVGLSSFRFLPSDGQNTLVGDRLLNEMAWGIVKKTQKKKRSKKKRRKLGVGFEDSLSDLIDELREGFLDRTVEEIKESIQNK